MEKDKRFMEASCWERLTEGEAGSCLWVGGGLPQGGGAVSAEVHAWDLLKEVAIIFISSTIVWPQVK